MPGVHWWRSEVRDRRPSTGERHPMKNSTTTISSTPSSAMVATTTGTSTPPRRTGTVAPGAGRRHPAGVPGAGPAAVTSSVCFSPAVPVPNATGTIMVADNAFRVLAAPPAPLAFDGRGITGLPDRHLDL